MAAPAWAEELTSIVRLHTMKGTLASGREIAHARLQALGLANEQQVLPQFKRSRGPA